MASAPHDDDGAMGGGAMERKERELTRSEEGELTRREEDELAAVARKLTADNLVAISRAIDMMGGEVAAVVNRELPQARFLQWRMFKNGSVCGIMLKERPPTQPHQTLQQALRVCKEAVVANMWLLRQGAGGVHVLELQSAEPGRGRELLLRTLRFLVANGAAHEAADVALLAQGGDEASTAKLRQMYEGLGMECTGSFATSLATGWGMRATVGAMLARAADVADSGLPLAGFNGALQGAAP
jgi:hypothetical protein